MQTTISRLAAQTWLAKIILIDKMSTIFAESVTSTLSDAYTLCMQKRNNSGSLLGTQLCNLPNMISIHL